MHTLTSGFHTLQAALSTFEDGHSVTQIINHKAVLFCSDSDNNCINILTIDDLHSPTTYAFAMCWPEESGHVLQLEAIYTKPGYREQGRALEALEALALKISSMGYIDKAKLEITADIRSDGGDACLRHLRKMLCNH